MKDTKMPSKRIAGAEIESVEEALKSISFFEELYLEPLYMELSPLFLGIDLMKSYERDKKDSLFYRESLGKRMKKSGIGRLLDELAKTDWRIRESYYEKIHRLSVGRHEWESKDRYEDIPCRKYIAGTGEDIVLPSVKEEAKAASSKFKEVIDEVPLFSPRSSAKDLLSLISDSILKRQYQHLGKLREELTKK